MKVYFDESGQSGSHLLDVNQPYFSLGSTNIEEAEAAEIIARCFPRTQADELKAQNVLRRKAGRRAFLDFASEVGNRPGHFCAAKVGKRFTVIAKMVDNLVEPVLRAQGYDFYAGDYAAQFANAAFLVFEGSLDPATAQNLMELYNAFARAPDNAKLRELEAALATAGRNASRESATLLDMMRTGARHFAEFHELDAFEGSSEFHVSAAIACMGHWQSQGSGPFDVIHDESTHFFRRSERWRMMTNQDLASTLLELGGKTLRLPIPVRSTVNGRSHESASLQLCDLIAGFVTRAYAPSPSEEFTSFLRAAEEAGMSELRVFPIDAGTDIPDGPPQRANGPDVVDRIATALRPLNKD